MLEFLGVIFIIIIVWGLLKAVFKEEKPKPTPKEYSFIMKPNMELFQEIVKDAELLNEKVERFKDSIEIEMKN